MWNYVLCDVIFNFRQAESVGFLELSIYLFISFLYTVTLAHMWLLNNLSSFVKNVIIVKHDTSAIGKTCPSVVLYCFLKYLREWQFFKEIVIFQKSDPFFVLFQTAITLLILTLYWKAMLFWKCLYPYFNFEWLFDVATEVKILLWHTYLGIWLPVLHAPSCIVTTNPSRTGLNPLNIDKTTVSLHHPYEQHFLETLIQERGIE